MDYKKISVEFLLDEDTQKHLAVVFDNYKEKCETTMTQESFFQMMMIEGSLRYINDKLNGYTEIIANHKPLVDKNKPNVAEVINKQDLPQFKEYLRECLSCDYDTMTEAQKRRAYDSWLESHNLLVFYDDVKRKQKCMEDEMYIEDYFTYNEDGFIYDKDTGEAIARYKD